MLTDVDYHIHSEHSFDANVSLDQIIDIAHRNKQKRISITDHDNIDAYSNKAALSKAAALGIEVVTGTELNINTPELLQQFHLLIYNFDPDCEKFHHLLKVNKQTPISNALAILKHLELTYGVEFCELDYLKIMKDPYSQALINLCHEYPKIPIKQLGFYNTIHHLPVGNALPIKDLFAMLNITDGDAVVAHPGWLSMSIPSLKSFFSGLKDLGLVGIEAYHPDHNNEQMMLYEAIAKEYGLLTTKGSDFHTLDKEIIIGRGINNNIRNRKITYVKKA